MSLIYLITTRSAWEAALENGFYESPSLKEEGFIHCSEAPQVQAVLGRYFQDQTDLVKLVIDTSLLKSHYVQEWSPSVNDTFPHIYGPVNISAVRMVERMLRY